MKKTALRFCALLFCAGAGFFAADASAQEATVIYGTTTPNVVSVTADRYIIYKSTVAGTMTATVIAVAGTVAGGVFTPRAAKATGMVFITLRGLDSCNVFFGCDAFGFENSSQFAQRLATLVAMDLRTLSMFAASGADMNERLGIVPFFSFAEEYLIYPFITAHKPAHVSLLITAGADINVKGSGGDNILHRFVHRGRITDVTLVIAAGADVNARNSANHTPLLQAVSESHLRGKRIALATALLSAGASVNVTSRFSDRRRTPLLFAALHNNITLLTILLSADAAVNVTSSSGETPLSLAAASMNITAVTALALAGAGVNVSVRGDYTPLILAASLNHFSAVTALLSSEASVNVTNGDGETPLLFAAANGSAAVITALLSAGADINAQNDDGNTPLDEAILGNHAGAIAALTANLGSCNTQSGDSRCPAGSPIAGFGANRPNLIFVVRSSELTEEGVVAAVVVGVP